MIQFTLSAKIGSSITTHGIKARGAFGAMVEAHRIIMGNSVADKRFKEGDIELKDESGDVVMSIKNDIEIISLFTPVMNSVKQNNEEMKDGFEDQTERTPNID